MMTLAWITGVGIPSLVGVALLVGAGLAWFQLPVVGRHVGVIAACIGVYLLADANGVSKGLAECKEASLRAELAAVRRDLDQAHEAGARAHSQSLLLAESQRRNQELVDEIANIPDACIADGGHVKRLLGIK